MYRTNYTMALQINSLNDFDASSVSFSALRINKARGNKTVYLSGSNKGKLNIQFPWMRAPFGLSSFTDAATNRTSYSLDLSFDKDNEELMMCQQKLEELDDLVVKTVEANSKEWLGKSFKAAVLKEALYKPLIRPGKDDYPSTIKMKVMVDNKTDKFIPEAYNMRQEQVDMSSLEKGMKVITIAEVASIWFIDNKFGVTVRLQQCLMEPPKKLPKFAFKGVEGVGVSGGGDAEEEEEVEYEYEEVEE
jgi:hypothetical protein